MEKDEIYNLLVSRLPEEQVKKDELMKNHTNFKIGGTTDFYVVAKSIEEVQSVMKISNEYNIPITILGNGSNVLVSDKGIRGIVLRIAVDKFEISKEKEYAIINVGGGVPLGRVAILLAKESISGFEFASGIPGTIGGSVRMNAGAYGGEMKDCIYSVTCITDTGDLKELSCEECKFSYRHSIFCDEKLTVVEVKLKLLYGNKEEIEEKIRQDAESRKEKQPLTYPSAGSVFKRGEDFIAAKLIDECGLKGYTVGGAQVSTLHAGFIINIGNATAQDVISVIEYVRKTVLEKTGKKLELEVELLGEY